MSKDKASHALLAVVTAQVSFLAAVVLSEEQVDVMLEVSRSVALSVDGESGDKVIDYLDVAKEGIMAMKEALLKG